MKQEYKKSMYVPQLEHDACGIGFTANLKGKKSHKIVADALTMLQNMEHRGGTGAEPNTGDGAGILIQNPHEFFAEICKKQGFELPNFGEYGVGFIFFPMDPEIRKKCKEEIKNIVKKFGFKLLGYRKVPTNNKDVGKSALAVEPYMEQFFIKPKYSLADPAALERRLFVIRKYTNPQVRAVVENAEDFHITTLSYKTIVYKGQLNTFQLKTYFPDLEDKKVKSAIALVHSRFSTNTFPKWKLAQPFRFIAHNGEINTIRGNLNWMKSYQSLFRSSLFTKEEIELITPLLDEKQSDSSNLDKTIEMLLLGGRSLPHVMMMLVPEAWQEHKTMQDPKKAFYQYHSSLIEPWDGPASICFTDGNVVGASLDRNGLRPSRYYLTDDDQLIMASETGVLPVPPENVVLKGRLMPGKIFIADLEQGRIISDEELKQDICSLQPYRKWLEENSLDIESIKLNKTCHKPKTKTLTERWQTYGFTNEDFKTILAPMCSTGKEPIGAMGADIPLAALSDESQHLANYFRQLFAQVSNPPIDPIRERVIMGLNTSVGKTLDILAEKPEHCRQISMKHPVLTNEDIDKLRAIEHPHFNCQIIDATFDINEPLEKAIDIICNEAEDAIRFGNNNILLISDRNINKNRAPIPSLLATGAIHHHLTNKGLRVRAGLVIESGDTRTTHHFATLIGYGANAVNPYMVFESIDELHNQKLLNKDVDFKKATENYIKAINGGLLKIFSKMGISTLQSYHGAQIFEIIGLSEEVVDKCFKGSISRINGIDFNGITKETLVRHKLAYPTEGMNKNDAIPTGGMFQWKRKGEYHAFNPQTIYLLQHATQTGNYELYKKYSSLVNEHSKKIATIRGVLDFKKQRKIMLEEVEPVEKIMKRFVTGAMSFGSLSYEAHSTLAIAMNRIGGRSNSGEGGEDPVRFKPKENGDWECSATKQVASGRFGVNIHYLSNAKEIQIKMAQGAKPGEGGHLPGHKVNDWIARVRNSTPGVALISPPPHHDIYSIEDLAQLIFDLKNSNRDAAINVKLVSEAGVGTIAAGVAKAHADAILVSGADGGTGASPISSIYHAGLPWELGIAETHQTLVLNNLRSRVTLQTDGQIKTGRDLAIAALLGAEEWGVATAALIVEGCIMMRKCNTNTCPVGVATQREELRKLFTGNPDHVVTFFRFMAEELREIMAELGFHTVNEMIGQVDVLKVNEKIDHWKIKKLDLSPILYKQPAGKDVGLYKQMQQDHGIANVLDWKLIEAAKPALENKEKISAEFKINNIDRTTGTMLSNEIAKKYEAEGLPQGTIHFKFNGSAGQSFGAFGAPGLKLELEGDANDYFGKGLSGAELIVYPSKKAKFVPEEHVLIGNVAFYGATKGEAYIRGLAGQRFCVRNSGVKAVVEGIGDHGCEYMTGGTVLVIGKTGRNFAAGMSGGVAYVYDPENEMPINCNMELVEFEPLEQNDVDMIKYLLEKQFKYTGSTVAEKLLNDFDNTLKSIVKVMPTDYKRALKEIEERKKQAVASTSK